MPIRSADLVPGSAVQTRAIQLGIPERTLQRYRQAGLIASPERRRHSAGRGVGRGAHFLYPRRVLEQLEAIASERSHSLAMMRHRLWWLGKPLETWEPWRDERIAELARLREESIQQRHATDEERDASVRAMVQHFSSDRRPEFPRRAIPASADRHTLVSMIRGVFYGVGGPIMDALSGVHPGTSPASIRSALEAALEEPVDSPYGATLGQLIQRAYPQAGSAGLSPGLWPIALMQFFDPWSAPDTMASISADEADRLRSLIWRTDPSAAAGPLLQSPIKAASCLVWLMTLDRNSPTPAAARGNSPVGSSARGAR